MILDDILIHTGAVVPDAEPGVSLIIIPGFDLDESILQLELLVMLDPHEDGIDGILQQLPDEDTGIGVQILARQQIDHLVLIHRHAELFRGEAVPLHIVVIDSIGQPEILPRTGRLGQLLGTVIQLLLHHIQISPNLLLLFGMVISRRIAENAVYDKLVEFSCLILQMLFRTLHLLLIPGMIQTKVPEQHLGRPADIIIQQICKPQQNSTQQKIILFLFISQLLTGQPGSVTAAQLQEIIFCNSFPYEYVRPFKTMLLDPLMMVHPDILAQQIFGDFAVLLIFHLVHGILSKMLLPAVIGRFSHLRFLVHANAHADVMAAGCHHQQRSLQRRQFLRMFSQQCIHPSTHSGTVVLIMKGKFRKKPVDIICKNQRRTADLFHCSNKRISIFRPRFLLKQLPELLLIYRFMIRHMRHSFELLEFCLYYSRVFSVSKGQ